jgi:hypothetical protein
VLGCRDNRPFHEQLHHHHHHIDLEGQELAIPRSSTQDAGKGSRSTGIVMHAGMIWWWWRCGGGRCMEEEEVEQE